MSSWWLDSLYLCSASSLFTSVHNFVFGVLGVLGHWRLVLVDLVYLAAGFGALDSLGSGTRRYTW